MAEQVGDPGRPARASARVLVVNARDEVLLLLGRLDGGGVGFLSPGGGIEAGESAREAAVRELREETGIVVAPEELVGPLHDGPVDWVDRAGVVRHVPSTVFAVAVDDPAVSGEGRTESEVCFLAGHAWVAPADLADDPRVRSSLLVPNAVRAVELVGTAADRMTGAGARPAHDSHDTDDTEDTEEER